ncbi:unnamed protein product [Rotaria sp. Silwood1]|nr:unnamed protein product [Rotaria sp. Silwood1]CAF4903650.1 unnamed protein product [Rotaria sp. Silwood1]
MIRLYFIVITYVLIIIPHTVNTFFLQDVANITVPRNLTCKLYTNESALGSFQLCAIRIYRHINESSTSSVVLHNGLRYMNTFRRLIQNNCSNNVNMSQAGTGVWTCGVRFPFESYTDLQICVCATNNCNENLNTCQESAMNSTNMSSSIDFMPNLTSIIQCNDTLNVSNTCMEHTLINASLCQDYIKNASVLCAITKNETIITQQSFIYENYEIYLSERIYLALFLMYNNNTWNISLSESTTNVYSKYIPPAARPVEECACTKSLCNQDITTCAPQMTTTTTTTQAPTTTSSSNQQNVEAGETGLGKAATAGIACGIIFSALIFTVEIIYFKFIYSGGANSGPNRSAAYRT